MESKPKEMSGNVDYMQLQPVKETIDVEHIQESVLKGVAFALSKVYSRRRQKMSNDMKENRYNSKQRLHEFNQEIKENLNIVDDNIITLLREHYRLGPQSEVEKNLLYTYNLPAYAMQYKLAIARDMTTDNKRYKSTLNTLDSISLIREPGHDMYMMDNSMNLMKVESKSFYAESRALARKQQVSVRSLMAWHSIRQLEHICNNLKEKHWKTIMTNGIVEDLDDLKVWHLKMSSNKSIFQYMRDNKNQLLTLTTMVMYNMSAYIVTIIENALSMKTSGTIKIVRGIWNMSVAMAYALSRQYNNIICRAQKDYISTDISLERKIEMFKLQLLMAMHGEIGNANTASILYETRGELDVIDWSENTKIFKQTNAEEAQKDATVVHSYIMSTIHNFIRQVAATVEEHMEDESVESMVLENASGEQCTTKWQLSWVNYAPSTTAIRMSFVDRDDPTKNLLVLLSSNSTAISTMQYLVGTISTWEAQSMNILTITLLKLVHDYANDRLVVIGSQTCWLSNKYKDMEDDSIRKTIDALSKSGIFILVCDMPIMLYAPVHIELIATEQKRTWDSESESHKGMKKNARTTVLSELETYTNEEHDTTELVMTFTLKSATDTTTIKIPSINQAYSAGEKSAIHTVHRETGSKIIVNVEEDNVDRKDYFQKAVQRETGSKIIVNVEEDNVDRKDYFQKESGTTYSNMWCEMFTGNWMNRQTVDKPRLVFIGGKQDIQTPSMITRNDGKTNAGENIMVWQDMREFPWTYKQVPRCHFENGMLLAEIYTRGTAETIKVVADTARLVRVKNSKIALRVANLQFTANMSFASAACQLNVIENEIFQAADRNHEIKTIHTYSTLKNECIHVDDMLVFGYLMDICLGGRLKVKRGDYTCWLPNNALSNDTEYNGPGYELKGLYPFPLQYKDTNYDRFTFDVPLKIPDKTLVRIAEINNNEEKEARDTSRGYTLAESEANAVGETRTKRLTMYISENKLIDMAMTYVGVEKVMETSVCWHVIAANLLSKEPEGTLRKTKIVETGPYNSLGMNTETTRRHNRPTSHVSCV